MTESLSPAAQAVLNAWESEWSKGSFCHEERSVAAALRVAVDQVVPETEEPRNQLEYELGVWDARDDVRGGLLAIAAELEGANE
jgi:hypothetical protein